MNKAPGRNQSPKRSGQGRVGRGHHAGSVREREGCEVGEVVSTKKGEKMEITIKIDEEHIAELVSQEIARRIVAEHGYENREAKIGIRDGVDKAIKQYIYSKKEAVIDRVVERASVEIVKKGLPKLLESLGREVK